MSRFSYDEDSRPMSMNQQRDLTLSINEFCFIQSRTNGVIRTYTGPITTPFSAQEAMVIFNPKTKQFEETSDFNRAKQLFVSAPEGWYIVLKNPEASNNHPDVGKASNSPDLVIGKKINIAGPCSFSLFPGQMAKVIQGHRLRSNQYLLARVYAADAANKNIEMATIVDTDGKEVKKKEKYFVGQLLVIKGTEVSFYIPPTGIEVIRVSGSGNEYVRDAVTLERLEYAILKDEDGEKRYVHGPAVVFPKPTETFVTAPKGGTIFRALELSPIS
jgi:major vault protein